MDIIRSPGRWARGLRWAGLFLLLALAAVATWYAAGLQPAPPEVERSTLWTSRVEEGPLVLEIRGNGLLVPEEIRWIAAASEGRVEVIHARPGKSVQADTIILELSNPELRQSLVDARWQLRAAEAELQSLTVQLQNQLLAQQSALEAVRSEHTQSAMRLEMNESLAHDGLVAEMDVRFSRVKTDELKARLALEEKRLRQYGDSIRVQLDVQQARIEQLRELGRLRQEQVDNLQVRAGIAGVLQELPVETGHRVATGANLAKVARPEPLKAELKIPENLARDIRLGQPAVIDTRQTKVPGRVVRIDPAVRDGAVKVDVTIDSALPPEARPDLSIDGTIELERLSKVLYTGRPALAASGVTLTLFRLDPDGLGASQVRAVVGRCSDRSMEIKSGLAPGDEIILSDMSRWDTFPRIRFK